LGIDQPQAGFGLNAADAAQAHAGVFADLGQGISG
jgi:hypothetical protein